MSDDENKRNNSEQKSKNGQLWMEGSTDTILKSYKNKQNNYVKAEKE